MYCCMKLIMDDRQRNVLESLRENEPIAEEITRNSSMLDKEQSDLLEDQKTFETLVDEVKEVLFVVNEERMYSNKTSLDEGKLVGTTGDKRVLLNVEQRPNKSADEGVIYNKVAFIPRSRLNQNYKKNNLIHLRAYLEKDFKAADIRWSFFVAACLSERFDITIHPFPPTFINDKMFKDVESLQNIIEETPPLTILLHEIRDAETCHIIEPILQLLNWMFITIKYPHLETMHKDSFKSILSQVPSEFSIPKPDLIFKVVTAADSPSERRWRELCSKNSTSFVYHGTQVENIHSIFHCGLQKNFGKYVRLQKRRRIHGIYLSKEISGIGTYTPSGFNWDVARRCGTKISCVALCEVINCDELIDVSNSGKHFDAKRKNLKNYDNDFQDLSKNYCVLTNDDMVRVKYLLVYSKPQYEKRRPTIYEWCREHKILACVLFYVIFVLSILLNYFCNKYFV